VGKWENGGAPLRKMFAGLAAIRLFFLCERFEAWLHMQLHFTATKLITNKREPKKGSDCGGKMENGENRGFVQGIQQIFSVRFHFGAPSPYLPCFTAPFLTLFFFVFNILFVLCLFSKLA